MHTSHVLVVSYRLIFFYFFSKKNRLINDVTRLLFENREIERTGFGYNPAQYSLVHHHFDGGGGSTFKNVIAFQMTGCHMFQMKVFNTLCLSSNSISLYFVFKNLSVFVFGIYIHHDDNNIVVVVVVLIKFQINFINTK